MTTHLDSLRDGPGGCPDFHGPGSLMANREGGTVRTLHGEFEIKGGCICRWCDPMRYSQTFGGGGHWEHAIEIGYGHLCPEWRGILVTPGSDEWGGDPERCRCGRGR